MMVMAKGGTKYQRREIKISKGEHFFPSPHSTPLLPHVHARFQKLYPTIGFVCHNCVTYAIQLDGANHDPTETY